MYPTEQISINGYHDATVPHAFYRQESETTHLALVLPGRGYNAHMPLLHYPAELMVFKGADVLRVDYAYDQNAEFQSSEVDEQMRWLFADVAAVYQMGLAQRDYEQITIIGKSLGTLAMGHLLTTQSMPTTVNAVWLTPLVRFEHLRQQIEQFGGHSLFVIGTADPHYDLEYLDEVKAATNGQIVTIEGADHGFDVGNNVLLSIRALEQVMREMEAFLS